MLISNSVSFNISTLFIGKIGIIAGRFVGKKDLVRSSSVTPQWANDL
jgi:hypothetical protein